MNFRDVSFREALAQVIETQRKEALKERIFGSLDLQIEAVDEEERKWAEFSYKKKERFLNPYNGLHGGIACTIADSCMGSTLCAATQSLPSTTDISVSFLEPITAAASTCEIREKESGKLCVTVMGRFIFAKKDILADEEASMLLKEQNA